MANSISSTNGAGTANPTPQDINRFLIPLSFLERISLIVKGIFSKEPFKYLCGIKYRINPDYIKCHHAAPRAFDVVYAKALQIIKSDLVAYVYNFPHHIAIAKCFARE
ncbi:MAG: hypothetical protein EB053_04085 [Chlamydiae bacterium]|jgi:hypothetical protein|nr:hypothetical protein [Chlamydiota bacterium]